MLWKLSLRSLKRRQDVGDSLFYHIGTPDGDFLISMPALYANIIADAIAMEPDKVFETIA